MAFILDRVPGSTPGGHATIRSPRPVQQVRRSLQMQSLGKIACGGFTESPGAFTAGDAVLPRAAAGETPTTEKAATDTATVRARSEFFMVGPLPNVCDVMPGVPRPSDHHSTAHTVPATESLGHNRLRQ